jgi:hypothetical protein
MLAQVRGEGIAQAVGHLSIVDQIGRDRAS